MMAKNKGILILSPSFTPNTGGVETHLDDLVAYLNRKHCQVFVLTYQPITTKAKGKSLEKRGSVLIKRVNWIGDNLFHKLEPYPVLEFLYLTPYLLLHTLWFLVINHDRISLIHAQGLNCAFIGALMKILFKKRLVVSTHAVYEMRAKSFRIKLISGVLNIADLVLALSNASREEIIRVGVDKEKVRVYRYWVDQETFRPFDKSKAREKLNWENKFTVLFVGRMIEKKGVLLLLKIALKDPETNFVFVGDGPMEDKVKKAARLKNNVFYYNRIENQKLPLFYNAADVLSVPSQYEEGFGRVILESVSCGTPVIASNLGGIPEAVDQRVAVLIKPEIRNLGEAIKNLKDNPQKLNYLSSNCRPFARERFSIENAEIIIDAYQNGD